MATALIPLAQETALEVELLIRAGGLAAAVALFGLIVVVPLFLSQRREIRRLMRWQELEPHRGDEGAALDIPAGAGPGVATSPAAGRVAATAATVPPAAPPADRSSEVSPAARVTADRPALARITAERAAISSPSFWRRLIARGPRHPLVLSLIAVFVAVALVAIVASQTGSLSMTDDGAAAGGLDRAEVQLVVLNASSQPALAQKVSDSLRAEGFESIRPGATGTQKQTVILFEKGSEKAARAVKRELGAQVIQPMDRRTRALAEGAQVVVVAGEDRART